MSVANIEAQIAELQAKLASEREAEQVNSTLQQLELSLKDVIATATTQGWAEQLLAMPLQELVSRATGKTGKKVTGARKRITNEEKEQAAFHILACCEANPPNRSTPDLRAYLNDEVPTVEWNASRLGNITDGLVEDGMLKETKQDRPNPSLFAITSKGKKQLASMAE